MSFARKCVYEFDGFRLDPAERLLLREGEPVLLTPKAFETLVVLVANSGRLLSKEELLHAVWPDTVVEENNLDRNISSLRKALGENGKGRRLIETVRGHGYRFTAAVTTSEATDGTGALRTAASDVAVTLTESGAPATSDGQTAAPWWQPFRRHRSALLGVALLLTVALSLGFWLHRRQFEEGRRELTVTRLLTDSGGVDFAALSPDGKYFVYRARGEKGWVLWLRQVAGGEPLEIVPAAEHAVAGTTFSPDGQFIYFVTQDQHDPQGALYRVPSLGGPRTKLLTGINSPVTFAPDGRQLAFTRALPDDEQSSLVIATSEGNNERTLLTRVKPERLDYKGPGWSPDGREIACVLRRAMTQTSDATYTIIGVDVLSGASRTLTAQQWDNCGRIAWLSDGRGFVTVGTRQGESGTTLRDQVWYVSQPDGAVRRITTDLSRHHYTSLSVTADGRALLITPYNTVSQIWSVTASNHGGQMRYDARTAVQLTAGTTEGRAGLIALADGRIVYIARTGEHVDLWQMNAAGKEQKQLTTDPPFMEELCAPLDGRFFVFASKRNDWHSHLFRVDADGLNLRQLSGGDSYEIDSDCSPDGRWIVYTSVLSSLAKQQLWKLPAEGGAPVRLSEVEAYTPRFSPDGKWVSYLYKAMREPTRWGVALISAEGGAPVKTFDLPERAQLNVGCRWTADGQALTYIVLDKNFSNLWAQPLDGGPAQPLTDFNSGQLYNYAFARDGQHLYLARGYPICDALLIRDFR